MNFVLGDEGLFTADVTEKMVQQFAEVSGDFNPIHMDEEYAKTTKFGRRIAHGMISAALISRFLVERYGGGIYLGQTLRFVNPVFIGDRVTVRLHISNLRADKGIATVRTIVRNQNDELCVKGEATIMKTDFLK